MKIRRLVLAICLGAMTAIGCGDGADGDLDTDEGAVRGRRNQGESYLTSRMKLIKCTMTDPDYLLSMSLDGGTFDLYRGNEDDATPLIRFESLTRQSSTKRIYRHLRVIDGCNPRTTVTCSSVPWFVVEFDEPSANRSKPFAMTLRVAEESRGHGIDDAAGECRFKFVE